LAMTSGGGGAVGVSRFVEGGRRCHGWRQLQSCGCGRSGNIRKCTLRDGIG
jgi:hypothetical protein